MRAFLWGVIGGFAPMLLGLLAGLGCAALTDGLDACDPGLFTARVQAKAIECRTDRIRECPGVSQDAFERNPMLCPIVLACYHDLDREAARCVGR